MPTTHYKPVGEKRKGGRPKKEEIVVRPFTAHINKTIKPENKLDYAREAIRTADGLYKRYNADYPNPLNIDKSELTKEARECWEYIFHMRGYDKAPTSERVFYTSDEVIFAFECYLRWVRNNNFVKGFTRPDGEPGVMPIIPNQTNFAQWLGVGNSLIGLRIRESAEAQNKYKQLLADCLSEGAMVGAYNTSSTIFTLKNMCDWADKYEDRSSNKADDLNVAEAEELVKQLGYTRERATLEPPKPMLEGDTNG